MGQQLRLSPYILLMASPISEQFEFTFLQISDFWEILYGEGQGNFESTVANCAIINESILSTKYCRK